MSIIEQSSAFAEVVSASPVVRARLELAALKLRSQISDELMRYGMLATDAQIEKIIAGIPNDNLIRLLAERT